MVDIGIRREDRGPHERRSPLAPSHVAALSRDRNLSFVVQPSSVRVFKDEEYAAAGARVAEDLSGCRLILGVKEIPPERILVGRTHACFSHTIKGQRSGMPALKKFLETGATLVDYECIVDDCGRRLVFFGYHAGFAGMVESLHALGRRWREEGIPNAFEALKRPMEYRNKAEIGEALKELGAKLARDGIPASKRPLVVGIAGYGNVSRGAQTALDLLSVVTVSPQTLLSGAEIPESDRKLVKVVFSEENMYRSKLGTGFSMEDYLRAPHRYDSIFYKYLPRLTVMVNCVYWDARFPRLVTIENLADLWDFKAGRSPAVIGDISCDIGGSVQATVRTSTMDLPVYVFDPVKKTTTDSYSGPGPSIIAIDILPSELAHDATMYFGDVLSPFVAELASIDPAASFEEARISPEIRRAVLVFGGRLTPAFGYLGKYL